MTLLGKRTEPVPNRRPSIAASQGSKTSDRRSGDVLSLPLIGRFIRWRHSRLVFQLPVFFVSLVMIAHAFWGPQLAPKNLAALLTWVHFRGLVVLVILLAGNLFCLSCPFVLVRDVARKIHAPRLRWPQWLSNKWPAAALFVTVLFTYELFDLFSEPWWTGMLIVGYFTLALLIDTLFKRASFCKFVCPIGQFNFLSATLSPLEVAVASPSVCDGCKSKDCIRGRREAIERDCSGLPVIRRGCELNLFQPRKVGNLDCTFCLDCVYACPEDNVGIFSRLPGEELAMTGSRSGIGMPEQRNDFAGLTVIFTFGAILNAFAMISPVYALENAIAKSTGLTVEWPILAAIFACLLVIEPALLLFGAAAISRRLSQSTDSLWGIVKQYAPSLLPIGFGIWLAHYGFHFFTGLLTVIPVSQNAAKQAFGSPWLGTPQWQLGGLPESIVYPIELGFLSLGLLGSWMVTWTITQRTNIKLERTGTTREIMSSPVYPKSTMATLIPWAVLHFLLFASAVWIMNQPMDMRGTFLGG